MSNTYKKTERPFKMKTKLKIASVLFFIVVLLYANRKSDIKTVGIYVGYAILIATPLLVLIRKYQTKLNKVPKEIYALLMVACMFFWRWLHSMSYAVEDILAFVVSLILVFGAFFVDEKDLKL